MAALPVDPLSEEVRAGRLAAQLLRGPPAPTPEAVTEHLLAVQGQDARGVRLAVRARTSGLTVRDFDSALAGRSLVISWLCRGTLHLVTAEDYFWLHELTVPPLAAGSRRRLAEEGVSPGQATRAAGLIAEWLAADGPLTRAELGERLSARGIPTAGQALVHILFHATLEGLIVRGPMKGRDQAFVLVRDWLGPRPPFPSRELALGELVRRYLIGHAPASERDLARWAALPLRDIRAGLQQIASQLSIRDDGLLELTRRRSRPGGVPSPRLLGAFDPLLVGWQDRTFVTAGRDAAVVSGGMFRPFVLSDGVVAGLWRVIRDDVVVEPFEPMPGGDPAALEREAEDVRRYLLLAGDDRA